MEHTPVDGHAALGLFALIDRFVVFRLYYLVLNYNYYIYYTFSLARENAPPTNGFRFRFFFKKKP